MRFWPCHQYFLGDNALTRSEQTLGLIWMAFITGNSSLGLLLEGLLPVVLAQIHIDLKKNPAKMAEKWPRFGGPQPSWQLGWAVNWVDRLHTSADKWMWSGRRAVVMVRWAAVGCGCSALICCSSWTGHWAAGHEWYPPPDCTDREKGRVLGVKLGFLRSRCGAVVSDVLCVRSYVHLYVCVYICVCVYVCGHVYI